MFRDDKFTKSSIFTKAYKEYHGGNLKMVDETERTLLFEVEDFVSCKPHSVRIWFDRHNNIVKYSCDCTIQSLKGQYGILCSHVVGAIAFSMFWVGRRKGRPKD